MRESLDMLQIETKAFFRRRHGNEQCRQQGHHAKAQGNTRWIRVRRKKFVSRKIMMNKE